MTEQEHTDKHLKTLGAKVANLAFYTMDDWIIAVDTKTKKVLHQGHELSAVELFDVLGIAVGGQSVECFEEAEAALLEQGIVLD